MKWYGIQLGLWFPLFGVCHLACRVQGNLILMPLVANQSYRHTVYPVDVLHHSAGFLWRSRCHFLMHLRTTIYKSGYFSFYTTIQYERFFLFVWIRALFAPHQWERTKEKSLERIIHSIINLHISQSDCTTYLLVLFMLFCRFVYGIALNYEASLARSLAHLFGRSVEGKKNLS